jgi:hypothetical protein
MPGFYRLDGQTPTLFVFATGKNRSRNQLVQRFYVIGGQIDELRVFLRRVSQNNRVARIGFA